VAAPTRARYLMFAGSVAGLIGLRLVVGALEAPSYPINSRVVTTWFPEREPSRRKTHSWIADGTMPPPGAADKPAHPCSHFR
jgi:MFS family permease